jgi:drug/metabolite transporter (DMT)-like permease
MKIWFPLLILVSLDAAGFLTYFISTTSAYLSIGAALSGTFAAVSAMLGWVVLKERVTALQSFSVAIIVMGVLTISYR